MNIQVFFVTQHSSIASNCYLDPKNGLHLQCQDLLIYHYATPAGTTPHEYTVYVFWVVTHLFEENVSVKPAFTERGQ